MPEIRATVFPRRLRSITLYFLLPGAIVIFVLFCNQYRHSIGRLQTHHKNPIAGNLRTPSVVTRNEIRHRLGKGFSQSKSLENISVDLFSMRIFNEISDMEDFTPKTFVSRILSRNIVNDLQHKFLIEGNHICTAPRPYLLIIIPSIVGHFTIRRAIRETWGKAIITNSWPREALNNTVRYLFFLGMDPQLSSTTLRNLRKESSIYRDIVLSDVRDSYRTLSRKIVSALQWVDTFCKTSEFVLKLDEDTFVNVPLILQVISLVASQTESSQFVLGQIHGSVRPAVLRTSRWAVDRKEYPFDFYPRYMYGHSYVISRQAVPLLVEMARHVRFIPPEDAYLTGILAKLAKVSRIDAPCFTVCCSDLFDCDVVRNVYVTMTSVDKAEDHYRLWKTVVDRRCHPQIAFNHKRRHPNVKPVTRALSGQDYNDLT